MRIHHIELLCQDVKLQESIFCSRFGFFPFGTWRDLLSQKQKIVLKKNSIFLVLHQDKDAPCDAIDNIALEVDNVKNIYDKMDRNLLCVAPKIIAEEGEGQPSSIEAALLRSPVGSVKHTILNKSNYSGPFLPNFAPIDAKTSFNAGTCENNLCYTEDIASTDEHITHLDHITFAVKRETTFSLMEWYQKYFGFKRCRVNNNERQDGFTVKTLTQNGSKLGLRLTAMQYYFCCEESLKIPQHSPSALEDMKFIFAESLTDQGPDQVQTFLQQNSGPGVQHIGLSSSNIFKSVTAWKTNNVQFIVPPKHYYNEVNDTIKKISQNGLRNLLEEHGILIDIEESDDENKELKYLLQVFTPPIFDQKTFFFELIQRHGATGFGAGNIAALWRAVDAHFKDKTENVNVNTTVQ